MSLQRQRLRCSDHLEQKGKPRPEGHHRFLANDIHRIVSDDLV
jgi:hypothetical protein